MKKPKVEHRRKQKLLKNSSKHSHSFSDNNSIKSSLSVVASKPNAKNLGLEPGLYIIATPIGNAQDITLRALDTLKKADVIVCEDTRVTSKLLSIHNINRPLMIYHEHNSKSAGPKIIEHLQRGKIVAFVSDAGTPLISDPGFRLVQACARKKIYVTHLPGASSVLTSLVLAELPTDKFLFAGFPPNKVGQRIKFFEDLNTVQATLVFMENSKRIVKSLNDMTRIFGSRDAAIGRELTKKFEEVRKGSLDELYKHYALVGAPKGEVTIVIGPPPKNKTKVPQKKIDILLKEIIKVKSLRDTVETVVTSTGAPRKDIYARALKLTSKTFTDGIIKKR